MNSNHPQFTSFGLATCTRRIAGIGAGAPEPSFSRCLRKYLIAPYRDSNPGHPSTN